MYRICESTMTPAMRMMKMIAGWGTLFPTRSIVSSIRPRNVCCGAVVSVIGGQAPPVVSLRASGAGRPEVDGEVAEETGSKRGGPDRPPRIVGVGHHRPADIEVAERDVAGEFL